MSRKLLGTLLILLLAGGAALYVGVGADGGPDVPSSDEPSAAERGSLADPAAVVDFATLEGDTTSLADYRGQVVLLNLWGTWCAPCRREIPDLVEVQAEIESRGGTIIGLAVDSGSPSEIRSFAENFGINYPIWHGAGERVVEHYRVMGYPTTLLIDREGVIRERYSGVQTSESLLADMEPYLES